MGYFNGKDFRDDLERMLENIARDMVSSLTTKNIIYSEPNDGSEDLKFIGLVEPISPELVEMMNGKTPAYSLRLSRFQLLDKPPMWDLYCPYVQGVLSGLVTETIPGIVSDIAQKLHTAAIKAEKVSVLRWHENNQKNHHDGCESVEEMSGLNTGCQGK